MLLVTIKGGFRSVYPTPPSQQQRWYLISDSERPTGVLIIEDGEGLSYSPSGEVRV